MKNYIITTYNLHKSYSDCPAFLFRQDPVFSQIPMHFVQEVSSM